MTALMICFATLTQAHNTPVYAFKADTAKKHLKKDGTPDKRFKENKAAKPPLKKDGTPDMRYKANKKADTAKKAKPAKAPKKKS
ncbi:hypothetical protein KXD93_02470 [Mucilaginibacter sp. BJC16-A38]|uniref:hypothetical protein n=1 Tax=Mucilaginibacter phenanthrenivorans TaxID=1234842 RepID=UPI002157A919|nr:hypothetical protein [Mucilaginibacter phenanthrenivorans]MCR8556485.1 hypothetical protein [Mucilaginibacter phenanthrenivorans]